MDENEFRNLYMARRNRPADPPLEAVAKFLRVFVADNFPDEIQKEIGTFAANDPREARRDLESLQAIIDDDSLEVGTVGDLVELEGGKPLDEPRDEEGRAYLRNLVALLQASLAQK